MELFVHGIVLLFLMFDLVSHYRHHRRNKKARESQTLYTLQEAFELIKEGIDNGSSRTHMAESSS